MKKFFILVLLAFLSVFSPDTICATERFDTSAKSCVVFEANSGRLLFEKNKEQKLPEASTTKIMTALVVSENAKMDKQVTIPKEAVGIEGSSIYLREGEKLTIKELLYGLMLRSGNDCAIALAIEIGGSVENFVSMMNQKAVQLGCKNTNFANPHGLPHESHYTTAYDLGLISCAAIKNETVKEIVSTKKISIGNYGYDYDRLLINKNKILTLFDGANGIKTGYTKKAGRCFVGSACRDGMQLVVVLLDCPPMFEESMSLMQKCFDEYHMKNLLKIDDVYNSVALPNRKTTFAQVKTVGDFSFPLKKDGSEDDKIKIFSKFEKLSEKNIKVGSIVGKTEVFLDDSFICSGKIVVEKI